MSKPLRYSDPEPARTDPTPEMQFMIYNISKAANVGNMIRSFVAFGGSTVVVVGEKKMRAFGDQNTMNYVRFNYFPDVKSAHASLKERGFDIVGIEIGENCVSILDPKESFKGKPVCFVFGSEGHGMSPQQKAILDRIVYIPQYGHGTASLNVSNAAAIVFHHYAVDANYTQQSITHEKFVVEEDKQLKRVIRDEDGNVILTEEQLRVREERAKKRRLEAEAQHDNTHELDSIDIQPQEQQSPSQDTGSIHSNTVVSIGEPS